MVVNNGRLIFLIQNNINDHINREWPDSLIEYIELVSCVEVDTNIMFMMNQNLTDHSLKTY